MPELPEVETMVRGIRDVMTGRTLCELRLCPCDCRPLTMSPLFAAMARRAKGQTVTAVRRVAKRIVIELSSGDSFVIEPRMTGLMLIADPPDREHLRLEWRMAGGGRTRQTRSVWFWDRRGLGVVRLCDPEELARRLGGESLGKDALLLTDSDWYEVCQRTARPIKVALLDQKLVAGIGNLYASEILHEARISPLQPASKVTREQARRLQTATQHVLLEAIEHEGSTLGDGTYRNALNQSGGYQNAHRVYDREDENCPTCRCGRIVRIVQAQRSTFFCRRCQGRGRG
ncbi:MAG: bifunctional DNA-formamidopyrimidine glycosylase/DNA-(apurinic or apyrimidinic site) lyase [Planctomycetes bacterium]|nr:bifunctional DNA-formamidopyrimidine glycosylase/DNA-(apurinic or apyrimidinic site) lyase [Planctomycetota bacterium]